MAAGSDSLNLIIDSSSVIFQYGPYEWTNLQYSQYYGSAIMVPEFALGLNDTAFHDPYGTFSVTFEGTSIAFVGNTPALSSSQTFLVSIDGSESSMNSYPNAAPQSYMQWYQSPELMEGTHTVVVDGLAGTSLDYAIVTVGLNTPLTGMEAIVDNEDLSVQWSNSWMLHSDLFNSNVLQSGFPYQNTTRRSCVNGDSMEFHFQGTSLSIYGIRTYPMIGMVTALFTLDGETSAETYVTTQDDVATGQGDLPNFLFTSYSNLAPQEHSLIINITGCADSSLILDYLTYTPSFYNLALKPTDDGAPSTSLPPSPTQPLPTTSAASGEASTVSPDSPYTTPVDTSSETSTFSAGSSSATSESGNANGAGGTQPKRIPLGAIIAVSVTFLLFIIALPFLWHRVRRSAQNDSIEESKEDMELVPFPPPEDTVPNQAATIPDRSHTYSPSGNVEMTHLRNYGQVNLESIAATERKQQEMLDYWANPRSDALSGYLGGMTANMSSFSRQSALAPIRRVSNSGLILDEGTIRPRTRRAIPSRPPPAYRATLVA